MVEEKKIKFFVKYFLVDKGDCIIKYVVLFLILWNIFISREKMFFYEFFLYWILFSKGFIGVFFILILI